MQIAVKVETGFNCNWRNIEPLQPEGFKGQTANEKETLKNRLRYQRKEGGQYDRCAQNTK